jgi:hypothetical protein
MWHEVALTGMVAICLRSKVDTPESLRRSAPAYVWAGPTRHHSLRAEVGDPAASWVSEELPGALAQALASVGRAGVLVTVRIHAVILGPSSGGQGPNNTSPDHR